MLELKQSNLIPAGILLASLCIGANQVFAQNVSVTVDASAVTHVISDYLYGANGNVADNVMNGTNANYNSLMRNSGIHYYRWPGGTTGDWQAWDSTSSVTYTQGLRCMDSVRGIFQPIVNFMGWWNNRAHTEQQAEAKAAAWVRDYNVNRHLNAKYWEIGNEDYGPWENSNVTRTGIAGADYGRRFCAFCDSMKKVDTTIKIGAVVTPPFPFDTLFGSFTARALDTIAKLHHIPDFLIVHIYPYIQMDQDTMVFGRNMLPFGPTHLKDTMTTGIWLDTLASSVDTLNKWVSTRFGASNVGKIEYFYTEYSTGSYATQNQTQAISAQFIAQVLMEFARLGVTGSNPWLSSYYAVAGNPTWYVHPMHIYHFGRQMVNVTLGTKGTRMRAWAARDSLGNLTMFLVNNAVDSTTYNAQIAIQGVAGVGAVGEKWTMLTSGAAGSWQPTRTAISINGTVSPAAGTIKNMAGQTIATGATFSVPLPPYSMTWLRIPITTATLPAGSVKNLPSGVMIRQTGKHGLTVTFCLQESFGKPWSLAVFTVGGKKVGAWRGTGNRATLALVTNARGVFICRAILGGNEYEKAIVMK